MVSVYKHISGATNMNSQREVAGVKHFAKQGYSLLYSIFSLYLSLNRIFTE